MLMSHDGDWENMFLSFIFTDMEKKLRGVRAGQWTGHTDTQQPISTTIIIGLLRDWRTASSR